LKTAKERNKMDNMLSSSLNIGSEDKEKESEVVLTPSVDLSKHPSGIVPTLQYYFSFFVLCPSFDRYLHCNQLGTLFPQLTWDANWISN
jgi:hypothetical protein